MRSVFALLALAACALAQRELPYTVSPTWDFCSCTFAARTLGRAPTNKNLIKISSTNCVERWVPNFHFIALCPSSTLPSVRDALCAAPGLTQAVGGDRLSAVQTDHVECSTKESPTMPQIIPSKLLPPKVHKSAC